MAALTGVRVVDFSTMIAVPLATSMLAEGGADVIKVEPPAGDGLRRVGSVCEGISNTFLFMNRGKRSIAVDIKTAEGLEVVQRLVAGADLVLHQFRAGVAERLGVGYEEVSARNPTVLYARLTGFGARGPFSTVRAYDPTMQAYSGISDLQGADGPPQGVRTAISDKVAALVVAHALMIGLADRARTGRGGLIETSMLQAMFWWLWPDMMRQHTFVTGDVKARPVSKRGNPSSSAAFETADGRYISAWAISDADWRALATGLGRDDWIDDSRFLTADLRNACMPDIVEMVRAEVRKHPYETLFQRLCESDATWAPVNNRDSLIDDEQVRANEMYIELEHGPQGTVRQPPLPFRIDDVSPAVLPAPQLGEHTEAILRELGYPNESIEELLQAGAVGCHQRTA